MFKKYLKFIISPKYVRIFQNVPQRFHHKYQKIPKIRQKYLQLTMHLNLKQKMTSHMQDRQDATTSVTPCTKTRPTKHQGVTRGHSAD